MKLKTFLLFINLIVMAPFFLFAQSEYLEDGISGTTFLIEGVVADGEISTIGFEAAYSIGGIMDFGVILNTESISIDSHSSTELNFSLLYNMIIIKQTEINPVNIQLVGSYGYVNTTSEYLDSYNRERTGQGFSFGASIFHELFRPNIIRVLLGGDLVYSNFLTSTIDNDDPNVPQIVSSIRSESFRYGGTVALSFAPELFPIFTAKLSVLYDPESEGFNYIPSICITNPMY